MPTQFWLHIEDSEPEFCPYCGEEYDAASAHHGEAGEREVVASDEMDERVDAQMYRCTTAN